MNVNTEYDNLLINLDFDFDLSCLSQDDFPKREFKTCVHCGSRYEVNNE